MPARTPAEIHTLVRDAFNAGDAGALAALYEPDAVLVFDGQPVHGSRAIRAVFAGYLRTRVRMTLETRSIVENEAEGLAVLHGTWTLEPVPPDADALATQGLSTEVVRRQADGTWLFVVDLPYTPPQ